MPCNRPASRVFNEVRRASRRNVLSRPCPIHGRQFSNRSSPPDGVAAYKVLIYSILGLGAGSALFYGSRRFGFRELHAEAPPAPVEITIEKPKKTKGLSKEQNRDIISSQHLQVKKSWENPGVYAWGSNSGRVVAPDSDEGLIKLPRRIPFFDGLLLRDLKLDRFFGAAITEKGDLLQWGTWYSTDAREPTPTLTGKDLTSISISRDRIIALGSNGTVYSLPVSQEDQARGPKPSESSWLPLWNSQSKISYRVIQPKDLGWGEKVSSISSGLEHALLLTNNGRLFSAASSSDGFPSRGQMGVPGLSWTTRPHGPYDQPHEITTLKGFDIIQIATGDFHSLALDKEGRVFTFGDNSSGQLGFEPSAESPYIDAPSLVPISRLYNGSNLTPRVTSVSAGGSNSFFTVDATRVAQPGEDPVQQIGLGRVTADTWACGQGILGTLGTSRWTHMQGTPSKLKALSGLSEWDEIKNVPVPIRLKRLSVGSTHASATMDNVTHVQAGTSSSTDSRNDTNWGADVLWWGGNEYYQLGMGKRNNLAVPGYIAPLDSAAEKERAKRKEEHRFQVTPRHKVDFNGRRTSTVFPSSQSLIRPSMEDSQKRKSEAGHGRSGAKKSKPWMGSRKGQSGNAAPSIEPGDAGIWVTCEMGKEGRCTSEVRDLFEEYAAKLYGETQKNVAEAKDNDDDDAEADIEAEINQEIRSLKSNPKREGALFQAVKMDIQCVLFFKTRPPIEPVEFVHTICKDALQGATKKCRWVKRLTPMITMGRATMEGLDRVAVSVLGPVFHSEGVGSKKFAIRPTKRNHNVMKRDEIIKQVARSVGSKHSVDLKNYDYLILIEVYKNVLGMSVVGSDFEELKQFNLAEIYDPPPKPTKPISTPNAGKNDSTPTPSAEGSKFEPTADDEMTNNASLDSVDAQVTDDQRIPNHLADGDKEAALTTSERGLAPPATEAEAKL